MSVRTGPRQIFLAAILAIGVLASPLGAPAASAAAFPDLPIPIPKGGGGSSFDLPSISGIKGQFKELKGQIKEIKELAPELIEEFAPDLKDLLP